MSDDTENEDPIFADRGFGRMEGLSVRIMDLSGANGSDPVEVVRGFETIAHANAFARRYVRDSVDRCRAAGMKPDAVLEAWFAYGEDAEVHGAGDDAWRSATELQDFAARRAKDPEERNWRVLDPRRDGDEEAEEE
jgi:phage tail tape-measure protein